MMLTNKVTEILGAIMGVALLAMAVLLVIQRGETRHFKKLYTAEQSAHALTVANYRKAAAEAAAADLANARAVEGYYANVAKEQTDDLRQKLDDARARAADYARRLRAPPESHPGGGNAADLPGAAESAGGAAGAGQAAVVAADALICAENTVKAKGWRDWWERVGGERK